MDIIKGIKEVGDVVRKADNIDLYRQILDLQREAMELVEENNDLRKEIAQMKESNELQESLIVEDNFYFKKKNNDLDGPFCTACWDQSSKLIRLNVVEHYPSSYYSSCPVCNTHMSIDSRLANR